VKDALEKAGVKATHAQLAVIAYEALKKAHKSPAMAVDGFADTVIAGGGLLMELMGLSRRDVNAAAMTYLHKCADDMAGGKPASATGAASQLATESQRVDDRRAGTDGEGGASLGANDSQRRSDRPDLSVSVRKHKRSAPGTKISTGAALRVAMRTYFDTLVIADKPVGDYRYAELAPTAAKLTASGVTHLRDAYVLRRLAKSVAYSPAMADQPVRAWADLSVIEAALKRVDELKEHAAPMLAGEVGLLVDRENMVAAA